MANLAKIAAIQLVSSDSVQDNLNQIEYYLAQAQKKQIQLVVLPENFAFMGKNEQDKLTLAEEYGKGEIQDCLSRWAKQYEMWIIAGSIPIKGSNENYVRARCLVYDDKGVCISFYDKIHLFDVSVSGEEQYRESSTIERGNQLVVVNTPFACIGLSICYDLRFPELYRQLVLKGAELITVPSAFTAVTGAAHWKTLLSARAIENLCYVIAPNQGGKHANGRETYGHSMIINPWGEILAEQPQGTGIIAAEIDLNYLRQLRRRFPCNEHHIL